MRGHPSQRVLNDEPYAIGLTFYRSVGHGFEVSVFPLDSARPVLHFRRMRVPRSHDTLAVRFGAIIRRFRLSRGISIEEAARESGESADHLRGIEEGLVGLSMETLLVFALRCSAPTSFPTARSVEFLHAIETLVEEELGVERWRELRTLVHGELDDGAEDVPEAKKFRLN